MRGTVPPGYTEVLYWKLTENRARLILINLLSIPLALAAGVFFFWFAAQFGRLVDVGVLADGLAVLVLILAIAATLGLHELAHGLAMRAFGARPRYGVMPAALALYATAPGYAFTRNQYLVVIFAPLASLSLLAMLGMMVFPGAVAAYVLALCATANAMGAAGDVYMGWRVARYPGRAYVIDEADGMRVFMPGSPLPT
jgi:hypothetical protein